LFSIAYKIDFRNWPLRPSDEEYTGIDALTLAPQDQKRPIADAVLGEAAGAALECAAKLPH